MFKVRLIVNYFVSDPHHRLKCVIEEFVTLEEAEHRIREMKTQGIELTDSHYGFYEIRDGMGPAVEIPKRKAS